MEKHYDYWDFLQVLGVDKYDTDKLKNFYGFIIKMDGVWMSGPNDQGYSFIDEEVARHFKNTINRPVLSFPCTAAEFRQFLNKTGIGYNISVEHEIWGLEGSLEDARTYSLLEAAIIAKIDSEELAEMLKESDVGTDVFSVERPYYTVGVNGGDTATVIIIGNEIVEVTGEEMSNKGKTRKTKVVKGKQLKDLLKSHGFPLPGEDESSFGNDPLKRGRPEGDFPRSTQARHKLPAGPGSPPAEITRVISSLYFHLLDEGKSDLLPAKRVEEFLAELDKFSTEPTEDGKEKPLHDEFQLKNKSQTYPELVEKVKPKSNKEAVLLKNPRLVKDRSGEKCSEKRPYTRLAIKKILYRLNKSLPPSS